MVSQTVFNAINLFITLLFLIRSFHATYVFSTDLALQEVISVLQPTISQETRFLGVVLFTEDHSKSKPEECSWPSLQKHGVS